jgi:CBS domain-containing protein
VQRVAVARKSLSFGAPQLAACLGRRLSVQTCEDILKTKGNDVFTIDADATIFQAVESMCAHRVGALLVCAAGTPRGVISERDVMTRMVLQRLSADATCVRDVMTSAVVCVEPRTTSSEAMATMTRTRCRHLPVVVDGRVVGVISIGDLIRGASQEQGVEIKLLSEYIHGA